MKRKITISAIVCLLEGCLGLVLAGGSLYAENDAASLVPVLNYNAGSLRDPFKSCLPKVEKKPAEAPVAAVKSEVRLPAMNLQGVIWEGRIRQAIIDNNVFTIGQNVHGAEIIGILKEGVKFLYGDTEFVLPSPAVVFQEEIMKKGGLNEKEKN